MRGVDHASGELRVPPPPIDSAHNDTYQTLQLTVLVLLRQICRKRQGIEWYASEPKGLLANSAHLSNVESKPNFHTQAPTELTLAYGRGAAPKLVRCIQNAGSSAVGSDESVLRFKAIEQSLELMIGAANLACLVSAGIVPALNLAASKDLDEKIRALAHTALARLACDRSARESMLASGTCETLLATAVDPAASVRSACLGVVTQLGTYDDGRKALIAVHFVELLLARCRERHDGGPQTPEVQAAALTGLNRLCKTDDGQAEAIRMSAVPTALMTIASEHPEVRCQSAWCLALTTYEQTEKAVALEGGVMPKLVKMLSSDDVEETAMRQRLRIAAAAFLMSMCNGARMEEDKPHPMGVAVDAGVCVALLPLVDEAASLHRMGEMTPEASDLAVYATKCIAALADSPKARKQLAKALPNLRELTTSTELALGKHAQIAIERITWTP